MRQPLVFTICILLNYTSAFLLFILRRKLIRHFTLSFNCLYIIDRILRRFCSTLGIQSIKCPIDDIL